MSGLPRRAIVTTVPFGAVDATPLALLKSAGIELVVNPIGRRLKAAEVAGVVGGFPVVIAGTETITAEAMGACQGLKAICRVGIGLDSVDLLAARRLGIAVSYTPDGPSPAVAELAVGLIIDLLRGVGPADRAVRGGDWQRISGARIATSCIGVVGVGRIGKRVIRHLQGGFAGVRILANDLVPDPTLDAVEWVDKETLYRQADVVTLHLPLTAATLGMIGAPELAMMKPTAVVVNTARGGIVNEVALLKALHSQTIAAAALDVFAEEPYRGELAKLPNVLLTCHMGSMTADCRARMEIEATQEAIRVLYGEPLRSPVPAEEYDIAERLARN
jgi:D-3-phosphoglycerate dehydrogenase